MQEILSPERLAEIQAELQTWLDDRNLTLRAVLQVSPKVTQAETEAKTEEPKTEPEAS